MSLVFCFLIMYSDYFVWDFKRYFEDETGFDFYEAGGSEADFNDYVVAFFAKGTLNPKTVLRVMNKYGLLSEIRRRRKYRQMVEQLHKYENLLNPEFHSDKPNQKWVTDISYIHTAQGVLYLSMIRDLYDHSDLHPKNMYHRKC